MKEILKAVVYLILIMFFIFATAVIVTYINQKYFWPDFTPRQGLISAIMGVFGAMIVSLGVEVEKLKKHLKIED